MFALSSSHFDTRGFSSIQDLARASVMASILRGPSDFYL